MYFDLLSPSQLAGALLPDLILVIGAMLLLLIAVWGSETMARARVTGLLAIGICAASFAAVVWLWHAQATASAGIIAVDAFRWATDCIVLAATIIAATLMIDYSEREQLVSAESYVLLLLAAGGMMLLAASRDLIIVFLGIELMSIASYVLCGLDRRSSRGAEAALKYFLLGAFSTGFLLYGIALVYGATGSTDIATIGTLVTGANYNDPLLLAGIGLLIVGFCFKVAAVPFHMWTPDVYEGAATPISAFMATAVKAAAFAAFLRVWIEAFPGATAAWVHPLQWLAVITMIGGNVIALQQKNMKRMLAYSSIAHAGYLLVTVVVANSLGASAFLFYLVAYTLATAGAFAVVIALGEPGERNQEIADYAGLWSAEPWLASAMAVFMLALLGFPIAGGMGFFAKWYVIDAALHAPHPQTVLAVILVIASVISCGYYLGVVLVMFMKPRPTNAPVVRPVPTGTFLVIYLSAFTLLLFGILPNGFVILAHDSVPISMVGAPAATPPVAAAASQ
ncbi:MAG: NADH-quinone oxidoreductase subunit N [Gemmatimonadaceae bacterium]